MRTGKGTGTVQCGGSPFKSLVLSDEDWTVFKVGLMTVRRLNALNALKTNKEGVGRFLVKFV